MDLPIILLHGALGAQSQLAPLAEVLRVERDVYSLNFAGHGGQAFVKGGYSMQKFAEDVRSYMDQEGIEKADFFGYDMGGYVALTLAAELPDRVNKIFTFATKFDWTVQTATKEVQKLAPEMILLQTPDFAKTLQERHAPLNWKEVLGDTAQMIISLAAGAAFSENDWSKITVPVQLTVGAEDKTVSTDETEKVQKALQNANFKILEAAPHAIERVNLHMLSSEILSFFNEL